jgi:PPP family 3-phenylpropionic acid transporter
MMNMTNQPRALFVAKAFYFLFYAAWASLLPFLALYYQSLGIPASRIGVLASAQTLTTLFSAPFWGGLADATRRHRQVLMGVILGAILSVFLLSRSASFWLLLPFIAAYAFFNAPIVPLIDHSVLALLADRPEDYGKQRLWGAVGWGLAAPVTGLIVEQHGLPGVFPVYIGIMCAGFLTAGILPITSQVRQGSLWGNIHTLLSDRRWLIFLAVVFLGGAGMAVINNYLFLYLSELHFSRTVMGLALTVATMSEVPILFFSGRMLQRWGPRSLLGVSLACFVIRVSGYSLASAPWQVLLLQLLHGLTFSALWAAGVAFAREAAPEGLGAMAQGLFSSVYMGLGAISGALAGGFLFEHMGGAGMFRWSSIAGILGLLFLWAARRRLAGRKASATVWQL